MDYQCNGCWYTTTIPELVTKHCCPLARSPRSVFNVSAITVAAVAQNFKFVNYSVGNDSPELETDFDFRYDILGFIADSYNLSIIPVNGKRYAATYFDSNRTDVGTMLLNNECDVAVSGHELNPVRLSKFSFIQPHEESWLVGYFVQPSASSLRDIYHNVFKYDLWLALVIIWALIIFTLWSVTTVETKWNLKEKGNRTFTEMFFLVVSVICQNGISVNSFSTSIKITIICCSCTALLIYSVYSAAIVSVLTWDVASIKSLKDLVSYQFTFSADHRRSSPKLCGFLTHLETEFPELKKDGRVVQVDGKIAFLKVLSTAEKLVYVTNTIDGSIINAMENAYPMSSLCKRLSTIILDRTPSSQSMIVKKGSPWRNYLNIKIIWEMNTGILYRIKKIKSEHSSSKRFLVETGQGKEILGLGIKDCFVAFAILITLYATSVFILIAENLFPQK